MVEIFFFVENLNLFLILTSFRSGVQTPLFSVQHVPGHELNGAAMVAEKIPKTSFIFFSVLRVWKVWWKILDWGVFIWPKAPEAGRSGVDCLERFQIYCSQGWKFDLNKNQDFWIDHKDRTNYQFQYSWNFPIKKVRNVLTRNIYFVSLWMNQETNVSKNFRNFICISFLRENYFKNGVFRWNKFRYCL